ncbi:hypothetical protein D3C72_535470 [compost metagenome]
MIRDAGRDHVKVQTCWVTVKSVDWDKKTMIATGVADDLDFEDVSLGIGYMYQKPAIGCLCLLGMIENQDAAAFLIDAEVVEELNLKTTVKATLNSPSTVFNDGKNRGLVKIKALEDNLDSLKLYIEAIHAALPGAFTAIGVGSAANGGTGSAIYLSGMAGKQIVIEDMENTDIKH